MGSSFVVDGRENDGVIMMPDFDPSSSPRNEGDDFEAMDGGLGRSGDGEWLNSLNDYYRIVFDPGLGWGHVFWLNELFQLGGAGVDEMIPGLDFERNCGLKLVLFSTEMMMMMVFFWDIADEIMRKF